jgi:hypothetical protein
VRDYVDGYLPRLPGGNRAISGSIVDDVHALDGEPGAQVTVHLVGTQWRDGLLPEVKSIDYPLGASGRVVELDPTTFDCAALSELTRPALLVWDPGQAVPSGLVSCPDAVAGARLTADGGDPLYRSIVLR